MSINRQTKSGKSNLSGFNRMEKFHPVKTLMFLGLVGSTILFLSVAFLYFMSVSRFTLPDSFILPKAFSVSTILLLLSSYSLSGVVNAFKNDSFRNLKLALVGTLFLGSLFCIAQIMGWKKLIDSGMFLNSNVGVAYLYIISGIHWLHSFIGLNSKYVTPIPDHRMNLVEKFTLSSPLGKDDTTIQIDQDPSNIEMADRRRILKIGFELISYEGYTNERPFTLTGCTRGLFQTTASPQPAGYMFRVLDVSEFGAQSVYINQDNNLQDEIAEKLKDIYDLGFKFCYYDGSEGVNPPFWLNVARAQWRVNKRLKPEPLFAEGAAKSHFSWHILSRGNAFDIFKPEVLKESIRQHPAAEAPRMKENFTHLNFGWLGYWVPNENTIGTQPDMLEYATSRAAAWDCPIGIQTNLKKFDDHPRTADNLEVLRRWEEVRINDWLTKEQKLSLQNLQQEHILLINEKNEFELQPYGQVMNVANNSREVRAFIFERGNSLYVVYWHISGTKKLELPLNHKNVTVMDNLQKKSSVGFSKLGGQITIPVSNRRYIKTTGITKDQMIMAFQNARII